MALRRRSANRVRDEAADAFLTASRALVGITVRSINAAPVEITVAQHRLLVLVATGAGQTVGTLAEQLEINQSNASRLCDRLQKLGLVTRGRSSTDGRAVNVVLTAEGHDVVQAVRAHRRVDVRRVLDQMSPSDVEAATQGLAAFGEAAHELGESSWVTFAP